MKQRDHFGVGSEHEKLIDPNVWRTVSKRTPLMNCFTAFGALMIIIGAKSLRGGESFQAELDNFHDFFFWMLAHIWVSLPIIGVVLIFAFLLAFFEWKRTRYAVTDDAVLYEYGIFIRHSKHINLNRVQVVDVNRPFLAGLLGVATVQVDCAGDADSNIVIRYLSIAQCQKLRKEIITKTMIVQGDGVVEKKVVQPDQQASNANNFEHASSSSSSSQLSEKTSLQKTISRAVFLNDDEDNAKILIATRNSNLLLRAIVSGRIVFLCVSGLITLAIAVINEGKFTLESLEKFFWPFLIIVIIPCVMTIWKEINGNWSMKLWIAHEGIRIRRGLTQAYTQTIRPERVLALKIYQTWSEHFLGLWSIKVDISGYENEREEGINGQQRSTLLVAGNLEQAMNIVWMLVPDLGVDNPKTLMNMALRGYHDDGGFLPSPRRAMIIDWFTWAARGVRTTDTVLLMRNGLIGRSLVIVPHGRTQSMYYTQGPLQRILGIATIGVNTVSTNIIAQVKHLPANECYQFFLKETTIARDMRRGEHLGEWYMRMQNLFPDKLS